MRRFAENTSVPVARSQAELSTLLDKIGATGLMIGRRIPRVVVGFEVNSKAIRFEMLIPEGKDPAQEERRCWRALLLIIKAKFEAQMSGVTTFETEFMPYFVMKNGKTLGENILPQLEDASQSGSTLKLLSM